MKVFVILLICANTVPLLAYPFVLLANMMGVASIGNSGATGGMVYASYAFMAASSLYPLAYVGFLVPTIRKMKRADHGKALCWQLAMVAYTLGVALLAIVWMQAE